MNDEEFKGQLDAMMRDYWNENLSKELNLDDINTEKALSKFNEIKNKNFDNLIESIRKFKERGGINRMMSTCLVCHQKLLKKNSLFLSRRLAAENPKNRITEYSNEILYFFHENCILNLLDKFIKEEFKEVSK